MNTSNEIVLAIDPGRDKCGLAIVGRDAVVHYRTVAATGGLEKIVGDLLRQFQPHTAVIGNGTGLTRVRQGLQNYVEAGIITMVPVDEKSSTEQARTRYWRENPPTGWRAWVPIGLLVSPSVDDWAAVILAERYFSKKD